MIGYLEGKIIAKGPKAIVVLTAGGLGYKVNIAEDTLKKIGQKKEVALFTHLAVREDSLDLFGFLKEEELAFFEILINVSGVGPKTAMNIIGLAPLPNLKRAIRDGDKNYLTKVSGLGKKTAEKIILELSDKLKDDLEGQELKTEIDALQALCSLGYSQKEAREALKKTKAATTEEKIKEALKILGQ